MEITRHAVRTGDAVGGEQKSKQRETSQSNITFLTFKEDLGLLGEMVRADLDTDANIHELPRELTGGIKLRHFSLFWMNF